MQKTLLQRIDEVIQKEKEALQNKTPLISGFVIETIISRGGGSITRRRPMTSEELRKANEAAKEWHGAELPICGGSCDECEGRAEYWAKRMGVTAQEIWDTVN